MKAYPFLGVSIIILLGFTATTNGQPITAQQQMQFCKFNQTPKVVDPIRDYEIIATNTATISSADAFQGNKIMYNVAAKPLNTKNIVTFNPLTGVLNIKAEYKDKFDIKVIAKNPCGSATTTFNVIIDEAA